MAELEYFPWYNSYCKRLAKLSDQEVGRLVRALAKYSETGETQELTGRESVAFDFIAVDIDRAKEAYCKKCETNRNNRQQPQTTDEDRQRPPVKGKGKGKANKETPTPDGVGAKKTPVNAAAAAVCADFLDRINPTASQNCLEELASFAETMGEAVCRRAFDIALDAKKATWPYIRAILRDKQAKGVKCLADWEAGEKKRPGKQNVQPNFQPDTERIQKNADWLDGFLAEQESGQT